MCRVRSIIFFVVAWCMACPAQEIIQHKPVCYGMTILLDTSEKYLEAMSGSLLAALIEQATPIVVSAHLLVTIQKHQDLAHLNPRDLFEEYKQLLQIPYMRRTDSQNERAKNIVLTIQRFTPKMASKWVIKVLSPDLYLMLPHTFLKKHGVLVHDVIAVVDTPASTPTERVLGLKVNHMPTVDYFSVGKYSTASRMSDLNKKLLQSLFVTRKEYFHNNCPDKMPVWSIVIEGHGFPDIAIASITINQFRAFLQFLDTQIHTKVCVYSTCYGAGVNHIHLFNDDRAQYSYPIICQSLTDAPVFIKTVSVYLNNNDILRVYSCKKFKKIFNKLTELDFINYASLSCLNLLKSFRSKQQPGMFNMAQIKKPEQRWFSVLHADKVIQIGTILAYTRINPLCLKQFFAHKYKKSSPVGLLLYTDNIPFEIVVDTCAMPAVVSMMPGSAVHHIAKISSTMQSAETIIDAFLTLYKLEARKLFVIHQLDARFDTLLQNTLTFITGILQDVIIDSSPDKQRVFFTVNQQVYVIDVTWNEISLLRTLSCAQATAADKHYLDMLLMSQVSSLYDASRAVDEIQQSGSIQAITAVLSHIMDKIPDNNFLCIEYLTCANSTHINDVLRVVHEYVTLKDCVYCWIGKIKKEDGTVLCNNCIICSDKVHGTVVLYTQVCKNTGMQFFQKAKSSFLRLEYDYKPYFKTILFSFLYSSDMQSIAGQKLKMAFEPGSLKKAVSSLIVQ